MMMHIKKAEKAEQKQKHESKANRAQNTNTQKRTIIGSLHSFLIKDHQSSIAIHTMLSTIARRGRLLSTSISIRCASTLIIAEPASDASALAPSTLAAISAAQKLHSGPITLMLNTSIDPSVVPSSISTILNTNQSDSLAETIAAAVKKAQETYSFSHIVAPATKFGSNVLPRAAAALNCSPITDIIDILSEDTFVRPIYAGSALAKVQSTEDVKVLSVRSTAFDQAEVDGSSATVVDLDVEKQILTEFVKANVSKSDRPELSSANIVVSGGRGMKNGENFHLLEALADKLGGAVGASRAAVDAGYVPNDLQVGQTGKVVAPDLYIAVGISGAIQHLSGMKDSKTIVAINSDAEAPIMQVADYALCQDLFKAVPELTEKL
jgi:electron transfer flavoprotein alpha subunit